MYAFRSSSTKGWGQRGVRVQYTLNDREFSDIKAIYAIGIRRKNTSMLCSGEFAEADIYTRILLTFLYFVIFLAILAFLSDYISIEK